MTISAIEQVLATAGPLHPTEATAPELAAQQRFAALLNSDQAADSPQALLTAQGAISELAIGADLTAKVAGLLTQSINKLVSMQ